MASSTTATSRAMFEGPIVATRAGSFDIQGGPSIGFVRVVLTSATKTVTDGASLAANTYAVVIGTGSSATSVTGVLVALYKSAPGSYSSSGQVMSSQPYGYAVRLDNSETYIPVVVTAATATSGIVTIGAHVSIGGKGSLQTANFASQIIAAGHVAAAPALASVPRHLLTAEYLLGLWGTHAITPQQAAPYLTWAQTSPADSTAIADAGIKVQAYVDPNQLGAGDPMFGGAVESDFAHTCSGARVTTTSDNTTRDETNPNSSTLQSYFRTYVSKLGGHIDMLFEDNGGALSPFATYSAGMPCSYSVASWTAGAIALNNASPIPVIANGLNTFTTSVSPVIGVLGSGNTAGGSMEHCYSDASQPIMGSSAWIIIENTEISVLRQGKIFECMARNLSTASTQVDARIFTLASFLLTYDPNKAILAEEFATSPSGLRVMPESGLVALDPIVPEPSDVSQLKTSSGAYGREYAHCYLRGTPVGACAVAISRDEGAPHPFPFPGYTRTLALSGNGVLDGGTASTNGPPPPTTMQPFMAVIAFR